MTQSSFFKPICYINFLQAINIFGYIEYKNKKSIESWRDYYFLYNLWLEDKNGNKNRYGTIYSDFNSEYMDFVKKVKIFSYNLVDIKNEMEINN